MSKEMEITLTVNGEKKRVKVSPRESLLHVLRNKLHYISIKGNCYRGECGICTVLMNGYPVKSCQVLALEADGANIITVEGLSKNGEPALIQKAFIEKFGFQCGFCTPAFILTGHYMVENMPNATDEDIKEVLNSIVCRCTGYKQIIDAIKLALQWKKEGKE